MSLSRSKSAARHLTNLARDAFSLLEVIAGLAVVSLILIPTSKLMQDVLHGEAVQRQRSELIHLAHGHEVELCHLMRTNFQETRLANSFASKGFPDLRFQTVCSQATSDGGIPNRLMSIRTLAWHDANANRSLDAGETAVDLWTAVAKALP